MIKSWPLGVIQTYGGVHCAYFPDLFATSLKNAVKVVTIINVMIDFLAIIINWAKKIISTESDL